ncbi:uncharacterized protein LOC128546034 [Mercenaria mercenaria]|uniref:uncharacterized protein LOC128546034 n=1 Tax=Mercenaria mercenaria TaxID=6596 RepID=UPI00234E3758|nr:uncharacterized protein LOC128546034 [Mercenaria mercenaria]
MIFRPVLTVLENLESNGLFDRESLIHRMCLQFSYLPIINNQLKEVCFIWNTHSIRKQKVGDIVPGIPNVLHSNPEIVGAQNYLNEDIADIQQLKDICSNNFLQIDEHFVNVASSILQTLNLPDPDHLSDMSDCKHMFIVLKEAFESLV